MKKVGYAVLGLGIGMAHAEAVLASENAELVAVCDKDPTRLAEAAELCPAARRYETMEELFADPAVEVISVCLPSGMHADAAVRAMEAGKHVLVEKPLDITVERALRIEEARVRTGKLCGVVHQNRFNRNMAPIKDAVDGGRLGKIFLGTFAVKWYRDQSYYDANGGWRGTWAMDGGGSLINQAIHTVDLMLWLMGDPVSVTSTTAVCDHKIETEDMTASIVRFAGGATATFVSTTCAYPGVSTEIGLYGTRGCIEADGDRLKTWKMRNAGDDEDAMDEEEGKMLARYGGGNRRAADASDASGVSALYGHRRVVEDMILAVRDGGTPDLSPLEAVKSVRLVRAIYESARTGKTVTL